MDNEDKEETIESLTDTDNTNTNPNTQVPDNQVVIEVPSTDDDDIPDPPEEEEPDEGGVILGNENVTDEPSDDSSKVWLAAPIGIVAIVAAVALTYILIVKGSCCSCCYDNKSLAKFKNKGKPTSNPATTPGTDNNDKDKSKYESMSTPKEGNKNVY